MYIAKATKRHLPGINAISAKWGLQPMPSRFLNQRDVCVIACTDEGQVVGCTWIGLMAGNYMGYFDFYTVDPEYLHKGVGKALAAAAIVEAKKRGAKLIVGNVRQDEVHDAVVTNALDVGMDADPWPHTFVAMEIK